MKKVVKFSGGLLLSLLYCFALYSVTQPLPETFTYHPNNPEQQQKVSKVSESIFSLTAVPENVVISFPSSGGHFLKIPLFNSVWFPKISEQLIASQFLQYKINQTNTLVNYRKNDSIFPFHYFW
ncbi:hypothetical protein [Formosa sp. 4Alg 33]|uniref:hypothetical protein n=1 Tax=Formosa sp. 4Alg 33 TaxID=3382189 RepID=UPI003D9C0204